MAKRKKSKRRYVKRCTAGITLDMWYMLSELKSRTGKSKASIIREALEEYDKSH